MGVTSFQGRLHVQWETLGAPLGVVWESSLTWLGRMATSRDPSDVVRRFRSHHQTREFDPPRFLAVAAASVAHTRELPLPQKQRITETRCKHIDIGFLLSLRCRLLPCCVLAG